MVKSVFCLNKKIPTGGGEQSQPFDFPKKKNINFYL